MKRTFFAIMLVAVGMMVWSCDGKKGDSKVADSDDTEDVVEATPADDGDDDEDDVTQAPTRGIDYIRKAWEGKSIKVEAGDSPGIENLTQVFCQKYPQCKTNEVLRDYLTYDSYEHELYYIESKPRNGYMSCIMAVETTHATYTCYWNRPNGHKLFAAFMEECFENTTSWDQCLVVFYDYDPTTDVMTPEPGITMMIEKRMKKYDCYSIVLPDEGKDIVVLGYMIDEEEDSADTTEFKLKWDGTSFDWIN